MGKKSIFNSRNKKNNVEDVFSSLRGDIQISFGNRLFSSLLYNSLVYAVECIEKSSLRKLIE